MAVQTKGRLLRGIENLDRNLSTGQFRLKTQVAYSILFKTDHSFCMACTGSKPRLISFQRTNLKKGSFCLRHQIPVDIQKIKHDPYSKSKMITLTMTPVSYSCFAGLLNPMQMAFAWHRAAHLPQRMHSALSGIRTGSTSMGHPRAHCPQETHFIAFTRRRYRLSLLSSP